VACMYMVNKSTKFDKVTKRILCLCVRLPFRFPMGSGLSPEQRLGLCCKLTKEIFIKTVIKNNIVKILLRALRTGGVGPLTRICGLTR